MSPRPSRPSNLGAGQSRTPARPRKVYLHDTRRSMKQTLRCTIIRPSTPLAALPSRHPPAPAATTLPPTTASHAAPRRQPSAFLSRPSLRRRSVHGWRLAFIWPADQRRTSTTVPRRSIDVAIARPDPRQAARPRSSVGSSTTPPFHLLQPWCCAEMDVSLGPWQRRRCCSCHCHCRTTEPLWQVIRDTICPSMACLRWTTAMYKEVPYRSPSCLSSFKQQTTSP